MASPRTLDARAPGDWRQVDWWFRDRTTGKIELGQPPNPPLLVWWATTGLRVLDRRAGQRPVLDAVRSGALMAWSADELLRGSSPHRRVLGGGVLGYQALKVLRRR